MENKKKPSMQRVRGKRDSYNNQMCTQGLKQDLGRPEEFKEGRVLEVGAKGSGLGGIQRWVGSKRWCCRVSEV